MFLYSMKAISKLGILYINCKIKRNKIMVKYYLQLYIYIYIYFTINRKITKIRWELIL